MKRSIRSRVYEGLRGEILDFHLAPGALLVEIELAERYGTSRTPVREALQQLAAEGLIRQVPGRGAFVSEISMSDLVELFQIREALEVQAVRLAAQAEDLSRLESSFKLLGEAPDHIDRGDFQWYYSLMKQIDDNIAFLANNRRLQNLLNDVWAQVYRVRRVATTNPSRLLESVEEHRTIMTAILERRVSDAEEAVRSHIQNSLRNILVSVASYG